MNHPTQEELVQFLYGELRPESRQRIQAHLGACAECGETLAGWKTASRRLDHWKVTRPKSPVAGLIMLRWAAGTVALIALCVAAFWWGHASATRDLRAVQAAIEPQLRRELRSEFATSLQTELSKAQAEQLKRASEETQRLLAQLESRRADEMQDVYNALLRLKRDVDTVALNADASLKLTEQQLIQLASVQSVGATETDKNNSSVR